MANITDNDQLTHDLAEHRLSRLFNRVCELGVLRRHGQSINEEEYREALLAYHAARSSLKLSRGSSHTP